MTCISFNLGFRNHIVIMVFFKNINYWWFWLRVWQWPQKGHFMMATKHWRLRSSFERVGSCVKEIVDHPLIFKYNVFSGKNEFSIFRYLSFYHPTLGIFHQRRAFLHFWELLPFQPWKWGITSRSNRLTAISFYLKIFGTIAILRMSLDLRFE